ncbi:M4 family metallopeptidase [Clostridium estertheticum]|uniref:M4 family metallopeptidase n=1 Tax=Clostridium estertheticum TaxID=238834 RepID=UPI0013E90BE9|nr:M4 family metallopeptidase [Clostridium estertheticum]MBZ9686673.1 M4 family metallopeptidase [Clostridium estertheticum]
MLSKKLVSLVVVSSLLFSGFVFPVHAKGNESNPPGFEKGKLSKQLSKDMKGVHQFFKENNIIIEDSVNQLAELKSSDDSLGFKHIKTQQMVKGIPVYGNEYIIHFNQNGEVYAINGKYDVNAKDAKINKGNFIGETKALEIAKAQVTFDELEAPPTTKLYLYNINDEYVPVYLVSLSFLSPTPGYWNFFVNAEDGTIIKQVNKISNVATTGTGLGVLGDTKTLNLNTATVKGKTQYQLVDTTKGALITTFTAANGTRTPGTTVFSTTNTINDKAAVDAHAYAGVVYDYYKSKFNRNSLDGLGMGIKSTVHYSRSYVNAFWNGTQMIYGDGDGVQAVALSGALDVVGHEMTHAVDENEANLIYEFQSGALNESLSDTFGAFIECYGQASKFDWLMGEDIWTPNIAGDALRDMSNPAKYGDPDNMSKFVVSPNTQAGDWGGVHTNSGIPNKACYLIASNPNVGINKAEQIYYRALANYLISASNFHDARVALVQSATDLYGASGSEVAAINAAWDAVGVN